MADRNVKAAIAAGEAERLLRRYGISSFGGNALDDLAFAMGITVLDAKLEGAAARLVRRGDRGIIRVSDGIVQRGRRQFSVAHELGHWVLHKHQSQMSACTNEQMRMSYVASPPELEANVFAANLLMPAASFAERLKGRRASWPMIQSLAEAFEVSLTAAAVRYVELVDDYCALAICKDGRIQWWRVSGRMQECKAWLDAKSTVPPDSIAADCFRGKATPRVAQEVSCRSWFGDLTGVHSDRLMEHVYALPKYRKVMSLLWLP